MTTKAKGDESKAQAAPKAEAAPLCGRPHFLPALAHVTCTESAPDPDLPPGSPEHEHRHQDGETLYAWR